MLACGGVPQGSPSQEISGDFVAVRKALTADEQLLLSGDGETSRLGDVGRHRRRRQSVAMPADDNDFYLAIRKSLLQEHWFLSAYVKQFHPDNAGALGDASLGTRVVSFKLQNDKLFLFDATDRLKASEVGDPTILLEAYPVVELPQFSDLPGSDDYVLVDPAQGLNEFAVSGNLFGDPYYPNALTTFPLSLGLSYMQGFRPLSDGATFEQVFAGQVTAIVQAGGAPTALDVWGTLGISLRRYEVGAGYEPTPLPQAEHFIASGPKLVSDSGGSIESDALRWNFHPGMEPVEFVVTAGAQRAQADFPDADILGAIERGIESWNEVFGFEVLRAVFVDSDDIVDDDQNTFIVDYPGQGLGFAFADLRNNPVNGEVRGGSVYMSGVFFDPHSFEDDEEPSEQGIPFAGLAGPASSNAIRWGVMSNTQPRCELRPPAEAFTDDESGPTQLTANEKVSRYVQHVAAHEMGHVLGLRHNFKGSLQPPTSSLMDYTTDANAVAAFEPQAYDRDAIRYLYQFSTDLPAQPFCSDGERFVDPLCAIFDSGEDPLFDHWAADYVPLFDLIAGVGLPASLLDQIGLNQILGFARDAGAIPEGDRQLAMSLALGRASSPLGEEDLAEPSSWAQLSAMAEHVLRRAVLDGPALRGAIALDITDDQVRAFLTEQAGSMARNEDGARTYSLRRTSVDVLRVLQRTDALAELQQTRDLLTEQLARGELSAEDASLTEDLLGRVRAALSPYFD